MSEHDVSWIDRGREPKCPSDPAYPDGKDVDAQLEAPMCCVKLPYPAARCGIWIVKCRTCGVSVGLTAAGRRDDPRSVRVPCGFDKLSMSLLGATGEFPEGKLDESDEGALRLAVGRDGDLIRIDFGKPVAWLGLPPEEAAELARAILKHADGLRQ